MSEIAILRYQNIKIIIASSVIDVNKEMKY